MKYLLTPLTEAVKANVHRWSGGAAHTTEAWLPDQSVACKEDLFASEKRRSEGNEVILSEKKFFAVTGSAIVSIFLFVWVLTRLWLAGR